MSLDLSQNIVIYLILILVILVFVVLFRINKLSKTQKRIHNNLRRLKFEVDKIQRLENHLAQSLTDVSSYKSWLEEDAHLKHQIKKKKEHKRKLRLSKYIQIKSKLLDNFDQFAGLKIMDKAGIGFFLLGLALFINVSMELNWINNFGRLFIGIILTILLLVGGYLIRNKFIHFSNILMGGGISAFIFSIFVAYYQYHIINLLLWYALTVFILISTIVIATSFKRHELALIAFIAAYLAPFTVNFISSDYLVLFSYLTLLNIGVLVYDYFQKSIAINLVSFGFTFMIYGIWLINLIYIQKESVPFFWSFIFLTLFYILFLMMIVINNIRSGKKFHKIEFSVMMSAKAIYLGVGIIIINEAGVDYQGLFMGLIAIINYTFFLYLYKKENFDRRILNFFLGLSIMFFTLIIPVQFYGKTITMIWSLQAFVLMFIAIKSKLDSMRLSSLFLTLGMIVSWAIEIYYQYISSTGSLDYIKPFLNEGFLTSILVIGSLISLILLLRSSDSEYFIEKKLKSKTYIAFLGVASILIVYFSLFMELKYWANQQFNSSDTVQTVMSLFNFAFISIAAIPVWFVKERKIGYVAISVAFLTGLIFIFYYTGIFTNLRNEYLLTLNVNRADFNIHYYTFFILMFIFISALKGITKAFTRASVLSYAIAIGLIFLIFWLVSVETSLHYTVKMYQPHLLINSIVEHIHRFSYTLIWTITTFIILLTGFLFKSQQIKTISILMYFIVLLKMFVYDYPKLTNQDMMINFVVYGGVLLLGSFLFHYLKPVDDTTSPKKIT